MGAVAGSDLASLRKERIVTLFLSHWKKSYSQRTYAIRGTSQVCCSQSLLLIKVIRNLLQSNITNDPDSS